MKLSRSPKPRLLALLSALSLSLAAALPAQTPGDSLPAIAPGPFAPTLESLASYKTPDWFRDAKFGIWAHWGPQAVPRAGDWYARNMYLQGSRQYQHHLATYGHPSEQGFKDIIPLWKAEKWEPDSLMALYKKAGAKYFVSMGVHHDNFDLWNSKFHTWNAVNMGPKRDVVGEWKRVAKKYGLRFGVSEHLGASYSWYASSHGSDTSGAKAGVPYDGTNPAFAELYHPASVDPATRKFPWYSPNVEWHAEWFSRIKDLVDNYQPDLLYTDGGIPFGSTGRSLVAHYYNANIKAHGGKLEGIYTHKNIGSGEFLAEAGAQDVERGVMKTGNPLPWQTDTSIGDWFYSDGYKYKSTAEIVHMLCDIVSKNGNMLLNVVLYADGSLPPEPRQFLDEMAAWMLVNSEAIHGTRPWTVYGEGPTQAAEGNFKENVAYTAQDIRFTTKGNTLYAITLGEPSNEVRVSSLASGASKRVTGVQLLGSKEKLQWSQTADALVINAPARLPSRFGSSFRITLAR